MKKRREVEVFSLSFMDSICCGFGAIILLFVLTIGPIKKDLEQNKTGVSDFQESLLKQLSEIESKVELWKTRHESIGSNTYNVESNELREKIQKLNDLESDIRATAVKSIEADSIVSSLRERAEQKSQAPELAPKTSPVGVTTDREYIVFIIDTSGSMRNIQGQMQPLVLGQMERVLNAFEETKGIQVLDTSGRYLIPSSAKNWITDNRQNRTIILRNLFHYPLASVSNPTPGLIRFFKDYESRIQLGDKMGVYIFGDEFPDSSTKILRIVENYNQLDPSTGERPVSINAIGFPFRLKNPPQPNQTGYKFANLMSRLTYEHGGSFMTAQ